METQETEETDPMIGRIVGPYLLESELGRGGMGTVYRASRIDGEFSQIVAIKLIKRGMDTDNILRRFRRERQILAALNHPNVAYFLGGGSTDDGLPYFVMEYIEGLPLYKYCSRNRLSIKERAALFRKICWAVAAAHELKIVHRDLKPSNIIVKPEGQPKLLDFGIAKVLDPDLFETEGEPTATQLRAMTPEYASPEQISGEKMGPASDIYSLGIILYELLTGHRPYRLTRRIPELDAKIIGEEMPTQPSRIVSSKDGIVPENGGTMTPEALAASRNATVASLSQNLSGELDKIILKALRKRPDERYGSVTELSDDITNFLEGRPVNAELFVTMSGSLGTRKSSTPSIAILPFRVLTAADHEHTAESIVGIGLADALISRLSGIRRLIVRPTTSVLAFEGRTAFEAARELGVDYILDGNIRLAGNRIRVSVQLYRTEADTAVWAQTFDKDVGDVLEIEDSVSAQVTDALLPRLTSEEREKLAKRSTNIPEAYEAYLRGRYFWSRFTDAGLLRAVSEFNKAIEIDPHYVLPYIGLADYYVWSAIFGEIPSRVGFPKAQEAIQKALEIDDSLGEAYAVLAFTALFYEWNWTEAERLIQRALELSPNFGFAHECYSNFLTAQKRFEEGIEEILKAEELDPVSPRAILMSAWTLYQAGQFERSVSKARKALAMQPDLPQGMLHLGNALIETGELDEAVGLLRNSAESWNRSGMPRYMLAFARARQNDQEAVNTILSKMIATSETGQMKPYFLAMAFFAAGKIDDAFRTLSAAVEERNEWLIWLGTEPKLERHRDDPRFAAILRAVHNPISDQTKITDPNGPDTGARIRSIAVLPFSPVGSSEDISAEQGYLGIGLADSITMRLSNIRRFTVRPTSSVIGFAGRDIDPFRAAAELGVEFIVTGIIRRIGDKIRVTAQLLDAAESATRWSASFLETIGDVLELEDLLSEQVIRNLLPHLSGDEEKMIGKRGTNDLEAHDAYLQGRYFWNQFTPDSFPKSINAFQKAISADPGFALAYVGIADYYTWAGIYGLIPPGESHPAVLEAAQKALSLDPGLGEAHAALGLYYSNMQQFASAEEHYRHAIELNPNYPLAHEWLSSILVGTGRFEDGISELLIAEGLDPLSLRPKVLSAWTIYQTRDFSRALEKARELIHLNPDFMQSHLQLANILLEIGENEAALFHAEKAVEIESNSPLPVYTLCSALAAGGRVGELDRLIEKWEMTASSAYVPPYFLGMSHLAAGRIELALKYLDEALKEYSPWVIWLGTEPKLDPIRDEPRFVQLLERSGNPIGRL